MATAHHNSASSPNGPDPRIERRPGMIHAHFISDPAHLAPVRTAVESLCVEIGFDSTASGEIGLATNEAIANIIRHAYGGAIDQPIELQAKATAGGIEITLRDWGSGKSPAQTGKEKPDDLLIPGGLGLMCIRQLMDVVLFTPQLRGMLLTMRRTKARKKNSPAKQT